MSRPDNNPSPVLIASPERHDTGPQAGSESFVWIVHELVNLLDGSLRNVGLAKSILQSKPAGQSPQADGTNPVERLELVDHSLRQMASLVRRWMDQTTRGTVTHERHQTLEQAVDQAVQLLTTAAAQRGVDVYVSLCDDVAQTPGSAIYPILINALRNSIQAINSVPVSPDGQSPTLGQIKVEGRQRDGMIELDVRDDGSGLDEAILNDQGQFKFGKTTKPDGHGIGLLLCRDIAAGLGGELILSNRSPRGAVLTIRYPLQERVPRH